MDQSKIEDVRIGSPAEAEGADSSDANELEMYQGWIDLVARIKENDPFAMEELYALFGKGVRFYICRQLGPQELDDKVHDTFVIVVEAIRSGEIREPERLMGFVRTIVRRQIASSIDLAVHLRKEQAEFESSTGIPDRRFDPEESAIQRERVALMAEVLGTLTRKDREVLSRFYLKEQSQEQICHEMGLSDTQFRLLKSRAKQRFGEAGKKKLVKRALTALFVRNSALGMH